MVPQVNPAMAPPESDTTDVPEPRLSDAVALPYNAVAPYSNMAVVEVPLGFTVPFRVAPVRLMPLAAPVATVGGQIAVVKVASTPFVVPPEFVATALKWYVVSQVRPVMAPPESETADAPEPRIADVVVLPYDTVGPYSNIPVVDAPFGFAVPFKVAPVAVMLPATPVVTVGGQAVVVKITSGPFVVPPTFVATSRKWYWMLHVKAVASPNTDIGKVPEPGLARGTV